MTTSFDYAFTKSVAAPNSSEGGFVLSNLPHDKGGPSLAGIARNKHPGWSGWALIDAGVLPTDQRIIDAVRLFYTQEFWLPISGDNLPPRIAAQVFKFAINAGTSLAIELMQNAAGVNVDGDIGAKTIAAVRAIDPLEFTIRFNSVCIDKYVTFKDWDFFSKSWARRVSAQLLEGLEK